jgi:uncharacterized membrane protein (UPF0127 family)
VGKLSQSCAIVLLVLSLSAQAFALNLSQAFTPLDLIDAQPQLRIQLGEASVLRKSPPPVLSLVVLSTSDAQKQGLMGVAEIPAGRGVLMDLRSQRFNGIWMKGMRTTMDLIFADATGVITGLHQNLPPCEKDPCRVYTASDMSLVIETTPGFITQHQLTLGQKIYRLP